MSEANLEATMKAMFDEFRAEFRAEMQELRALIEGLQRSATPDELVGAEYVAKLFHCAVASVRKGQAGTKEVRWLSRHPLRTTRRSA